MKKLVNYLCLTGIISTIFYLLHDIIGAINYPGYDWMSRAVSDLTATDSPSFIIANSFVTIHKIFSCLCCACICIQIQNEKRKSLRIGVYLFSVMNYISAIGYSLFPLTSSGYDGSTQSFIHVYIITILVVLLSIISLILIAVGSLKEKRLLGILSLVSLALMFIGAVASQNVDKSVFGIFERFSTYSAVIYTTILGIYCYNIKGNIIEK